MTDEVGKRYVVKTTRSARNGISRQLQFIAIDQQSPETAAIWLGRVWSCIDDLEFLPRRHAIAEGYDRVRYVVRRAIVHSHLILFTIDSATDTVYVVGIRHGARRPRPKDLPSAPADDDVT